MSDLDNELNELEELEALCDDEPAEKANSTAKQSTESKSNSTSAHKAPPSDTLEPGEIVVINPLEGAGDLRSMVEFDDLDAALREQSALFAYYAQCAARAMIQQNRAKQNLEKTAAQLNHAYRQKAIDSKEKITEKALESKVVTATAYQNAQECLNDAQYIYKLCQSVVEAFHQREQMLIQSCKRAELDMMMKGAFSGGGNRAERDEFVRQSLKQS